MNELSRGMPRDRKEAVLLTADLAELGMGEVVAAVEMYKREGNADMAQWVADTYAVLCSVDFLYRESEWV